MILNNSKKLNPLICCDIGDAFGGGFGAGDGVSGDMGGFGGFGGGGVGDGLGFDVATAPAMSPVAMDFSQALSLGKTGFALGGFPGGMLGALAGLAYGYSNSVSEDEAAGISSGLSGLFGGGNLSNNIGLNFGGGDGGPGGLASNSQFTPSQLQLQSLLSQYGITGPPDPTTLEGSAMANIDLQKSQLAKIEELTGPYRKAGTDVALPNLSALAFGGNVDYQPSQLYNQQLSAGRQGVMRSQAAGGAGVKSSRTFERLADLVSGLAGEDMGRFEQGNQTLLNQGLTATNQLGQAGSQLTGNIGNIYGNLGQGLNLAAQQRGQGQLAQSQTLKSGVTGLGDLLSTLYKGN